MGPCTVPSAQTCPTRTPAPWRNRVTPGRRSDILSAPPMLAWPSKRQKTIDRLWFCTTKYPPLDGRCYGFSMVPGTILLPYTHIVGVYSFALIFVSARTIKTHSTPEFSKGLETDNPVFSTTMPKRCEVISSLLRAFFASIRRAFFRSASSKNAARTSIRISGNRYRPVFSRISILTPRLQRFIPMLTTKHQHFSLQSETPPCWSVGRGGA
jgi:hypothetical protein